MTRSAKAKNGHPPKVCVACNRPFEWRKKWERDWDQVRWCSDACRSGKANALNDNLEAK
ncbi:MAG: DUF2256 domain-containing protein [Actinomycetes bacterium]